MFCFALSGRSSARLAGLCAAAALAGCGRQAPVAEPVRSVKVMTVAGANVRASREYSGDVRARVETSLGFRTTGKVLQRLVEPGQHVRAGQVLSRLDPSDLQLAIQSAAAQVSAATTQRDLAAAEFRRYASLRDQGFISGAELERREASLRAAQAQLEQAQAHSSMQRNQAAYASLVAPVGGVVVSVAAEAGQVIASGVPAVRLAMDGERDAVFFVPEGEVSRIRVGTAVSIRPWAGGPRLAGRVREVAANADPVTRTFQVKAAIDGESPPLGATVAVSVADVDAADAADAAAIKVPARAVLKQGQGSGVWVLEDASMTVRLQPVQLGGFEGDDAIVAAGLVPGMQVVTGGVHVLTPGQKVSLWKVQP